MHIGFWHYATGETLSLELYPPGGGTQANGSEPDSLSEPDVVNVPGYYETDVEESLTGVYVARVRREGVLIYSGKVVALPGAEHCVIDVAEAGNVTHVRGYPLTETAPGLFADNLSVVLDNDGQPTSLTLDDLASGGGGGGGSVTVGAFDPAALSQLSSSRAIHVSVPALVGQQLSQPIIRGDSYLAEHGRSLDFSREDFPDIPDGSTVTLTAVLRGGTGDASFSLSGSVLVATGVKVLRFEPTSLQTRDFVPGTYEFDVEVLFPDGNSATFVGPHVMLRVVADITTAA